MVKLFFESDREFTISSRAQILHTFFSTEYRPKFFRLFKAGLFTSKSFKVLYCSSYVEQSLHACLKVDAIKKKQIGLI